VRWQKWEINETIRGMKSLLFIFEGINSSALKGVKLEIFGKVERKAFNGRMTTKIDEN
jgi:hypothetical protein